MVKPVQRLAAVTGFGGEFGESLTFTSIEALASRLHDIRAGRGLDVRACQATFDGETAFEALNVYAKPRSGDPDWIATVAGPGADRVDDLLAALRRTQTSTKRKAA